MESKERTFVPTYDFDKKGTTRTSRTATELNNAYQALEKVRRLNFFLACQEHNIVEVDYEKCPVCVLNAAKGGRFRSGLLFNDDESRMMLPEPDDQFTPKYLRLDGYSMRSDPNNNNNKTNNHFHRCLACWTPSCPKHSSKAFKREGITVCQECETIFGMDFILDCMTLTTERRKAQVEKLIDMYDHTLLLLQFSNSCMDDIIDGLQTTRKQHNTIHMGGSSVGVLSGVFGVAAAANALTPAVGLPLMVASLLFGTGAVAAPIGTEVRQKFFSEPNHLADRLLTLHGMLLSVLTVSGMLRDAALRDQEKTRQFAEHSTVLTDLRRDYIPNRWALLDGMTTASRSGLWAHADVVGAGMAANQIALARSARLVSRSSSAAASAHATAAAARTTFSFITVASGALAGASILLELNSLAKTLSAIRAGNPCEKAQALRRVQESLTHLPLTDHLDKECRSFLTYMDCRGHRWNEDEAVQLIWEVSKNSENNNEEEKQLSDSDDEIEEAALL